MNALLGGIFFLVVVLVVIPAMYMAWPTITIIIGMLLAYIGLFIAFKVMGL